MKLIKLSTKQTIVFSEILRDISQVFFASAVVTPLLLGAEHSDQLVLVSGVVLSTLLWIVSVILIKE